MRRYRRNADLDARELERRFAAGDRRAGVALVRHLFGAGQLTLQRAMDLGDIVPEAMGELDPRFAEGLGYLFATGEHGTRGAYHRMLAADGQFFPDHHSAEVCPRGHRNDAGAEWTDVEMEHRSRGVLGHNMEGLLMVEGLSEGHDGPVAGNYLGCFTPLGEPSGPYGARGPFCSSYWRVDRDEIEYV
jgi:hypothetical protein